jgi:tetratricopeptide (TPR) repeat protein
MMRKRVTRSGGDGGWRGTARAAAALVLGALVLGACGGAEPAAMDDLELARRLRLAREAILRHLPESARAELDRCAEARPDDPEVLFQRARLAALPGVDDVGSARALLERVVALEPRHVAAHRAMAALDAGADAHRQAVEAAYGPLGTHELDLAAAYERGTVPPVAFPPPPSLAPGVADYRELVDGFQALRRAGYYDPVAAVRAVERVLAAYPDLAALRHQYAHALDTFEVRIPTRLAPAALDTVDADLPPITSRVTLDLARRHYAAAYDRVLPGTGVGYACLRSLAEVALKMGEWEEAYVLFELALGDRRADAGLRDRLRLRQVLARHKQGRDREALEHFHATLGAEPGHGLNALWTLHLVQAGLGLPLDERAPRFHLSSSIEVPEPGATPPFADVAAELGVDKLDGLGPSAWGDVDHDGDDDLFLCGCDSYGQLLLAGDGRFADATRAAGLGDVASGYSATLADADGDGWLDLYVGRDGWNGPAENSLYRNVEGRFEDVTERARVGDPGSSFVHLWSDVDRDGDVDLYVANGITGGGDVNRLYANDGKGAFSDATSRMGLLEPRGTRTIGVAAGDYDADGWPDLFCSGYQGPNRLYRNRGEEQGPRFAEVGEQAGVRDEAHVTNGYVAFFADLDADGDLDVLRTALAPYDEVLFRLSAMSDLEDLGTDRNTLRLYRNEGGGRFSDGTAAAGLDVPIGVMGAGCADLDNDGWLDLYLGTGDPDLGRLEPDRFLHNREGRFRDRTFALGFGNVGKGHGVTFADHDRDGDLDVYAQEGGFVHGDAWRNAFYANRGFADGNRWLAITLEGVESNREGIDAQVRVTAGGRTLLRERRNGEGFGCSNTPAVEVGLGAADEIERVEIRWPSGLVQMFDDVPVDARIHVREGERWR